jgi:hypothetical protein
VDGAQVVAQGLFPSGLHVKVLLSPSAPRGARVTELAGDEPLLLQPSKGRVEPAEAHVLAIVPISLEFEDIGMATRTTVAALVRRTSTGFF